MSGPYEMGWRRDSDREPLADTLAHAAERFRLNWPGARIIGFVVSTRQSGPVPERFDGLPVVAQRRVQPGSVHVLGAPDTAPAQGGLFGGAEIGYVPREAAAQGRMAL